MKLIVSLSPNIPGLIVTPNCTCFSANAKKYIYLKTAKNCLDICLCKSWKLEDSKSLGVVIYNYSVDNTDILSAANIWCLSEEINRSMQIAVRRLKKLLIWGFGRYTQRHTSQFLKKKNKPGQLTDIFFPHTLLIRAFTEMVDNYLFHAIWQLFVRRGLGGISSCLSTRASWFLSLRHSTEKFCQCSHITWWSYHTPKLLPVMPVNPAVHVAVLTAVTAVQLF